MTDQDWDNYLQQSSALGILRPDAVFDIYGTGNADNADNADSAGSAGGAGGSGAEADVFNNQTPVPLSSGPTSAVRVLRTGHTPNGQSIFVADDYLSPYYPHPDGASFAVIDRRAAVPATHSNIASSAQHAPGPPSSHCPPNGTAFVLCDIPPYQSSIPFTQTMDNTTKRTLSVDYVVVVSGEVVVCLQGGEERTVQAGEVIVQQGTKHTWVNRTLNPCRLLYVMVAGKPISLPNGRTLERDS